MHHTSVLLRVRTVAYSDKCSVTGVTVFLVWLTLYRDNLWKGARPAALVPLTVLLVAARAAVDTV